MPSRSIRIATRQSALALWQAEYVKSQLLAAYPDMQVDLVPMTTKGDQILDAPLAKVGGKGLFIKELEVAMQEGRADIAVHSMKDVPVDMPEGFGIHAICEREDPRDAFVSNKYQSLAEVPQNGVIGTSSLRRQVQIRALRPDIRIRDLRGNVNTRLAKLDEGQYDAIILAAAGLIRLDMQHRITAWLTVQDSLPAVGQGAVGIECRDDDVELIELLAPLHHPATATRVIAERALNAKLQGGCQVPIGSHAEWDGNQLKVTGLVGGVTSQTIIRAQHCGDPQQAHRLGEEVAQMLFEQNARGLLDEAYS